MSSLPLEVYHVLEEEYVSAHGPLPRPPVTYKNCVLNEPEARAILRACGIHDAPGICEALDGLVTGDDDLAVLKASPALSACGHQLIDDYEQSVELAEKRDPMWGRLELRRSIVDDAMGGSVRSLRDVRLAHVYKAVHALPDDSPRTALCISGGGIRSATFALGVIQGLASAGILKKFDYLSTVSGGGYIGSWLSSWVRRHPDGMRGVEKDLHRADTAIGDVAPPDGEEYGRERSKIDPEPVPIRHLRDYSNYLSPRLGILSADSWTLASLYVRNLLLNLLVIVPLLALALAIPRFFSWGLAQTRGFDPLSHPWFAAIAVTVAFGFIGAARPLEGGRSSKTRFSSNTAYCFGVIVPLLVASCSLALFWARANDPQYGRHLLTHQRAIAALIAAVVGMVIVPWATYYGRIWFMDANARGSGFLDTKAQRRFVLSKMAYEFFGVTVALVTAAALFLLLAVKIFPHPLLPTPTLELLDPFQRLGKSASPEAQLYVCLAVPAALLVFFIQASIFVGLSSRRNDDADREWWGRGGALLLMTAIGIAVFSFISVFGPVALYYAPALLASIGGIAGIAAAVLGYSDKTPANQKEKEGAGTSAMIGNLASALIIPLFVVFVLAATSLGTTWLLQELWGGGVDESAVARELATTWQRHEVVREPVTGALIETRNSLPQQPRMRLAPLQATAHLQTIQFSTGRHLLLIVAIAALAFLLSLSIGVNKFSMHALYRNRLIRAYLGASRGRRTPDPFTGFDERDNLQMYELRPELLWATNINAQFIDALRKPSGDAERVKLAGYLWGALDDRTRKVLQNGLNDAAFDALSQNINYLMMTVDLAKEASVALPASVQCDPKTQIGASRPVRNRALLDHYFSDELCSMPACSEERGPLHIVNVALNLTSGQNLAWQQRMAESFTISPYHCGSLYVGYRDSLDYGGARGISLGTAVTISGAAASPNMGYHSSPAMAFLMTLFNVRLGSWLGNPGLFGQKSYSSAHPWTNLRPLIHELTGGSTDQSKWIYLSDGGHFENLALYEMVLRRCRYIVVSDAGADPKFSFEDLGNAIRKIRTDLGVPIDVLEQIEMHPREEDGTFGKGRYVARAAIRYSVVDEGGVDGTLIYIKAGIYSDANLPRDVYNYAQESTAFPHESTADQFFSESQFESYRALGRHAINEICANYTPEKEVADVPDRHRIPIAKRFENVPAFDCVVRSHLRPVPQGDQKST